MGNFSNWFKGLKGRLMILVGIPAFVVVVLAGVSVRGVDYLNSQVSLFAEKRIPITGNLWELRSSMNALVKFSWSSYGAMGNSGELATEIESLKARDLAFNKTLEELKTADLLPRTKELIVKIEKQKREFDAELKQFIASLGSSTDSESAKNILTSKIEPQADLIIEELRELTKLGEERNEELKTLALADGKQTQNTIYGTVIGGLLLTLLFGAILAKQLSEKLSSITASINDSSDKVNESSIQLSTASQQLSGSASEAAASLQETVSAIQELSSMVKMNASNAKEAAALSNHSKNSAETGEKEMAKLIMSMSEISQSSKKIEEIINVIDDIAFQTNLLALNAAVEAARAGEQGKGFAVVADAVRNLAHRSSVAAKDIANLIKEGVQKSDNGAKVAEKSGEVLKEIVLSVKKVTELISEISTASQEQSTGIEQIGKAMDQLDQSTQGNASAAEQVAASSEEMSSQATQLKSLVNNLASVVDGASNEKLFHDETPVRKGRDKIVSIAKYKKPKAEAVIPFEGEGAKVGTTDGF